MLDVYCRIHVDTAAEQFFYILIPLGMAAARRVAVSQFIDEKYLRMSCEGLVQIEFL